MKPKLSKTTTRKRADEAARWSPAELNRLVEEATVDCYVEVHGRCALASNAETFNYIRPRMRSKRQRGVAGL